MTITSSRAARRVTQFIGIGAATALALTTLGASGASARTIAGGSIDCASLSLTEVEGGRLVENWDGIQKDRNNYTADEKIAMERDYRARAKEIGYEDVDLLDIKDPIEVEVYMHIVREDLTVEGGNVPRKWLRAQMKYFNHSFRGHGHSEPGARSPYKFDLAGVTRTTNQDWFLNADQSAVEREMKEALREPSSTAETLNVYYTNLINGGLLGYAYLPEDYEQVGVLDGVVVESQSLPGGSVENYNLGGTVSHEVGHWAGLLHTFDGGCTEAGGGDLVEDTPAQDSPTSGCPADRDSCASEPGQDPIHNYMDYSYDECYNQFTIGQRERMVDQWYVYRDGVE